MPSPHLKEFTVENFEAEVLGANQPVLVSFFAEWNGLSRELAPTLEKLADEFFGRAKVGRVDTDSEPPLTKLFGVARLPMSIVIHNGEPVEKLPGLQPEDALRAALLKAMMQ